MAEYRRYQPRRSNAQKGGWGRWVIVAGVLVVVLIVGKVLIGKKSNNQKTSNKPAAATSEISLVTDNANSVMTNINLTNTVTNTNTQATMPAGSWKNFSITSCPSAISSFGTIKRAVLTIAFSAANDATTKVFDSLRQAGVPADFFSSGTFATKNPTIVKQAVQNGYAVYSQSFDSTDLTTLSDAQVTNAISKAETAISSATGVSTKPIFRPPAGSYTAQTVSALNKQGYCAVLWTVDAYDWQNGITVDQAKERVVSALAKQSGGVIIALHAGYDVTPELVTALVTSLKDQGYTIVNLATLLNS